MGMGVGAAAISKLMTGTVTFPTGEGELGRVMAEFGPILGITFMLFRLALAIGLVAQALGAARRREPLALLLAPLTLSALLFGVSEQPTEQGFMVIGIAFTLAALRVAKPETFLAPPRRTRQQPVRYSMQ